MVVTDCTRQEAGEAADGLDRLRAWGEQCPTFTVRCRAALETLYQALRQRERECPPPSITVKED